jgi:hypothetical protein
MNIDPIKTEILILLAPVTERMRKKMQGTPEELRALTDEKVKSAIKLFKEHPEIELDDEIFERFFLQTRNSKDKEISDFGRELVFKVCSDQEVAALSWERRLSPVVIEDEKITIIHEALAEMDREKFWADMVNWKPKKLIITRENGPTINYKKRVLNLLANEKPPLQDLTDEYTLKFRTGETLVATKARLLLCGGFFKDLFRNNVKGIDNKTINLPDISLNGFSGVIDMLEKAKLGSTVKIQEFNQAIGILQFRVVLVDKKLISPQEGLAGMDKENFWADVIAWKPKKLIITSKNGPTINYKKRVLNLLANEKPPLQDLTEEYTLKFRTGETLVETKARLLLCGYFFKDLFRDNAKGIDNKTINLPDISLNGFSGVIDVLEKGKLDPTVNVQEFNRVSDILSFD